MKQQGNCVAVFSLAYRPFVGGAEIAVEEIMRRIPERQFICFTHRFDASWFVAEKGENWRVIRVGRGRGGYYAQRWAKLTYIWRAWRAAEKLHRQESFIAVWGIMAAYGGMAALLFKLRHPRVPLLLTLQEGDAEEHILRRVGVLYPLWRMVFSRADRIQAISHYLADFARRHGATCPIDVVPNGVDITKFQDQKLKNKKANRKEKIIITTSRLVRKNGVDILIRALAELSEEYYLRIVGDGPERGALETLATSLGITERVSFIGQVPPDAIPNELKNADIFVRPSRSEGLGSSFLEAMAVGLPVIGTRVGGIPDFLKDGETGFFADIESPEDVALQIGRVFSEKGLHERMGKRGKLLVAERYDWECIAFDMEETLRKLLRVRLVLATGIYPPDIGGPATYAALVEKELGKRGASVEVVTYGPAGVSRKLPKGIRHGAYFFACAKRGLRTDIILVQDTVSSGVPAFLAAKLLRMKFVVRVPGDYAWEQAVQRFGVDDSIDSFQGKRYGLRVEALRFLQSYIVRRAHAVVVPSAYFKKLVAGWGVSPERVHVIYNGIELPYRAQDVVRRERHIISGGRLVPWKGFVFLIELMRELPGWSLSIFGDGPERENLARTIAAHGLQDRVTLWGSVEREELCAWYALAELFALNTHFESFSFQIVEAMSFGLPVVATRVGNLGEIIESGVNGFLVEPDNATEFLQAIRKIENDAGVRSRISREASATAKKFSIERTVDSLYALLYTL
jgi:glycosyltransferase involved in cell wall biosynthesis